MEQRADNAGVIPWQADTRPLWSGPTRQSDAIDSEPSHTAAAVARAGNGFADIAVERSHRASRYNGSGRECEKEHSSNATFESCALESASR